MIASSVTRRPYRRVTLYLANGLVTSGTPIGNLIGGGGLAAAFDGVTSQNSSVTANANSPAYIGKTFSSSIRVKSVSFFGSNNAGYIAGSEPSVTINLRGKNGSAPVDGTDGTLLGTLTFTDTANESVGKSITSTDKITPYTHVFLEIISTTAGVRFAELQIYRV